MSTGGGAMHFIRGPKFLPRPNQNSILKLQLLLWERPELMNVPVTASGGSPSELMNRHNRSQGPTQKRTQGECLQFFFPSPHEAAVWPSATIAKNMCVFHSNKLISTNVLALDGCFSREKPYHDEGDSLMWTGPQWMDPLVIA